MNGRPTKFAAALEACGWGHALEGLTPVLLSAQEDERQRIAADLHDEIGQCLSAVQFAIGGLREQIGDRLTAPEHEMFACLAGRISQAMDEVRRICMGLRPPMLDDLGIVSTIDWYCGELRQVLANVEVVQQVRANEIAIPAPVKLAIFRILQEACSNSCKHACARRLLVLLETDADGIRLEVADDGVGFDPVLARGRLRGVGLCSMRERATMTDGFLAIRSEVGVGTRVVASWRAQRPLASATGRRFSTT